MGRLPKICSTLLIVAAQCIVGNAGAAPIGSAVYVVGQVDVVDPAGVARTLSAKTPVSEGDVLVSGVNGLAVVVLADNTRITIKPDSRVSINEFLQDDDANALIEIFQGGLRVITGKIAGDQPDRFNIRTPLGSIGVRGTDFGVAECDRPCVESSRQSMAQPLQEGNYLVPVWQGRIVLRNCNPAVDVDNGKTGVMSGSQPGQCEVVPAIIPIDIPSPATFAHADRFHLTDNSHLSRMDLDPATFQEFKQWYDRGYPAATVMLHALSIGIPLADAVYMSVKIDPSRDLEVLRLAQELSKNIPGWLCYNASIQGKYARKATLDDLGARQTLAGAAELYRDARKVAAPGATFNVTKEELIGLIRDNHTYRPHAGDDGNVYAIISTAGDIVIDGDADAINSAPGATVPVSIVYLRDNERLAGLQGGNMTLRALLEDFVNEDKRIAPTWRPADFHKMAGIDEIREVLAVPGTDSIPPEEFARIESEIRANGNQLNAPLRLTLLRSGEGQVWIDKPAVAAVAESMGVVNIPLLLYFHDIGRQACGVAADCIQQICDAAIAGGGRDNICEISEAKPITVPYSCGECS